MLDTFCTDPRSTWIQDGSGRPRPCAQRVDRSPSTARSGVLGSEYELTVTDLCSARSLSAGMVIVAAGLAGEELSAASTATTVKLYGVDAVSPLTRRVVWSVTAMRRPSW